MEYTKNSIMDYIKKNLHCNENQADAIYELAYSYGHSNGLSEVYCYAQELCDMVIKFNGRK